MGWREPAFTIGVAPPAVSSDVFFKLLLPRAKVVRLSEEARRIPQQHAATVTGLLPPNDDECFEAENHNENMPEASRDDDVGCGAGLHRKYGSDEDIDASASGIRFVHLSGHGHSDD